MKKLNIKKTAILLSILALVLGACCSEEFYYNKALDYEEKGEYEKAIEYLDKVIIKNPLRIWAYVNRAADKFELSDFQGAIEDYSKVLSIDTMLVAGYMGMARAYMELKDYSTALANYNHAAEKSGFIEMENTVIAFSMGSAVMPNALFKYDSKYENPFYSATDIFFERGVAHFFLGNSNLALRDFEFCLSNEISLKMKGKCHYWIGHIYLRAGYRAEGCNELKTAKMLGHSYAEKDYDYYCRGKTRIENE